MIRFAYLIAAILLPLAAHASFGGGGSCNSFACHFTIIGILIGVSGGIPASAFVFAMLHLMFRNEERSKVNQVVVGALIGIVAFEVGAIGWACVASTSTSAGTSDRGPLIGFAVPYLLIAALSVYYVRSAPRTK